MKVFSPVYKLSKHLLFLSLLYVTVCFRFNCGVKSVTNLVSLVDSVREVPLVELALAQPERVGRLDQVVQRFAPDSLFLEISAISKVYFLFSSSPK